MKKLRYGIILAFATAALLFSGCNPDSPDETGNQNQQTENNSENNNGSSDNQNSNSGNSDNTDNQNSNSDNSENIDNIDDSGSSSVEYNLGLSDLGSGWNSEYDSSTKTITFSDAWAGRGWWLGALDASAYSSIEIQFESASFDIQLVIEYSEGESVKKYVTAGSTSISLDLDSSRKSNIKQIYIQNSEAGSLTLKKAVLKGNGNTSYSSDDSGNESGNGNDSGDSSEGDDSTGDSSQNFSVEKLPPPENFKAISSTADSITLQWDSVDGAYYYVIFYNNINDIDTEKVKTAYGTTTTFSDLSSNTDYYFWIATVNINNEIGDSHYQTVARTKAQESSSGSGNNSGNGNQGTGSQTSKNLQDLVNGETNAFDRITLSKSYFTLYNGTSIRVKDAIGKDYGDLKIVLYRSSASDRNDLSEYEKIDSSTTSASGGYVLYDNSISFDNSSNYYYIIAIEDEFGRSLSKNVMQYSLKTNPDVSIVYNSKAYYYYAITKYNTLAELESSDTEYNGWKVEESGTSVTKKYSPAITAGTYNVWQAVGSKDWSKLVSDYTFYNGIAYTIKSSGAITPAINTGALTVLSLDAE